MREIGKHIAFMKKRKIRQQCEHKFEEKNIKIAITVKNIKCQIPTYSMQIKYFVQGFTRKKKPIFISLKLFNW